MEVNKKEYKESKKLINNENLPLFLKGKTCQKLLDFIVSLQKSVQSKNKTQTSNENLVK